MKPPQVPPSPLPPSQDPDGDARREALRFIARRASIWIVPLTAIGILAIALGIPWWITVAVLIVAYAIVVFELDI